MIVTGKKVILRETDSADPELAKLIEDADYLSGMSEVRLYPKEMPTEITFRIELNNELIGEVRLRNLRWYNRKAEISVVISPKVQGKGYGRDAITAAARYAFERMNLHRLEAEVIEYNKASRLLLEELGFSSEGRLREAKFSSGKYFDIIRYGMLAEEYYKKHKNI
ncbi:MAG: N-acetyltransferase [Melioribacteraceae bacterium]|nr:MAG: N-acetyltransferase [Melioribacteraceae bacterium]